MLTPILILVTILSIIFLLKTKTFISFILIMETALLMNILILMFSAKINMEIYWMMIFLCFSACEACIGLSLLVMVMRSYGFDYVFQFKTKNN